MKVDILCDNLYCANNIYDLLVTSTSGTGVLSGEKICLDEHIMIPDIMQFDLNDEELNAVRKLPGVKRARKSYDNYSTQYNIIQGRTGPVSSASRYNRNSQQMPYYLQSLENYDTDFKNLNSNFTQYTVDCSNVDIILIDSGASHNDISSNLVQFNWSLLKEGDPINGTNIVNSLPQYYYSNDYGGHGTACASIICGSKFGIARNAKLYILKATGLVTSPDQGFNITDCLKLVLAFQKAKKLNLHNLDSSRPTVFSNSWGYYTNVAPKLAYHLGIISGDGGTSTRNFALQNNGVNVGRGDFYYYNFRTNGQNDTVDSYMREIISEGVHTVVAAGNQNSYCVNHPLSTIYAHFFTLNSSYYWIVKTVENSSSYTQGISYSDGTGGNYIYQGDDYVDFYCSPNIGKGFSKLEYPIIQVGCANGLGLTPSMFAPQGYNNYDDEFNYTEEGICLYYTLSAMSQNAPGFRFDTTRYTGISSIQFSRVTYSNYGPDVDIYAPGNSVWAAKSELGTYDDTILFIEGQRYRYFNGTSSACPIVAGVLATYLSDNPTATPLQAKNWLLTNAISGNILETAPSTNFVTVSSYNGSSVSTLTLPTGVGDFLNYINYHQNPDYYDQVIFDFFYPNFFNGYTGVSSMAEAFRKPKAPDSVQYKFKFLDSNNLMVQAYPLRKGIFNNSAPTISIAGATLTKTQSTNLKPTHSV
jgi:subtilisin family serine protease